jgi:F-type H+-transporting ATPase subunit b
MPRCCPIVVFALLALLLAAAPALAAAGEHQPSITDPRFDLTIWSIIIFVILFLVLRRYAWGPILEGLHKREEHIKAAVEEAKRAREETERMKTQFQAELAKAHEEIPKMMEAARKDAQQLAEEMRTRAQAEIQADRQRLRREIETARDQALHEIWNQAAQLATLISAKAIRRSLTPEDHRRLMDEALEELKHRGERR